MRRLLAILLLLIAVGAAVGGGMWAFMKASGAEVDICERGDACTSGWYGEAVFLVFAVFVGAAGFTLLRR